MTVDPPFVTQLLLEQAPEFAALTPRMTTTSGSSNWVFRLGDDLAVRLPRDDAYAEDLRTEVAWLPRLGPALPVPVPAIRHVGVPSALFPRPWAVVTWIPGATPAELDAAGQATLARAFGRFTRALHGFDVTGVVDAHLSAGYRTGEPVTDATDAWVDEAATDLADLFDPARVREAWRRLRDVAPRGGPPCLVHADLSAENVLVGRDGALVGVIDFGGLGLGDPAVDLLYAWDLLDPPARVVLREVAGVDDVTWQRARAWSFVGPGLVTIAGYRTTMPTRTARLVAMVEAVAGEVGVDLRG